MLLTNAIQEKNVKNLALSLFVFYVCLGALSSDRTVIVKIDEFS